MPQGRQYRDSGRMVIHVEQGKRGPRPLRHAVHRNCSASFVHIGDWRDPRTGCFPDAIPSIRSTLSCCMPPAARRVPRRVSASASPFTHTAPQLRHPPAGGGGTDIRIIQALLGHRNVNTTARYAQVATSTIRGYSKPTRPTTPRGNTAALRRDDASHAGGGGYLPPPRRSVPSQPWRSPRQ